VSLTSHLNLKLTKSTNTPQGDVNVEMHMPNNVHDFDNGSHVDSEDFQVVQMESDSMVIIWHDDHLTLLIVFFIEWSFG
jgi:hypothetical protein